MRIVRISLLVLLALSAAANAGDDPKLDVYGRSVFMMHYDDSLQRVDFASHVVDDAEDEFNFNPRDTRIGVRASSVDGPWTFGSNFEIDFYGDNAGNNLLPRLRVGYAEAKHENGWSLRGGQDWLPIAKMNPGTLDFGILSWGGNLWWRLPQFTVRYANEGLEYTLSAAMHRNSNDQEIDEQMPWLMGRIAATDVLAEGVTLAVGGGVRSVTIGETASDPGVDYSPYVVAAELKAKLGVVTLTAEAFAGQGVGREFVRYGLDYNPYHPDGATEIVSKGGFVSLNAPVSRKVQVNVGAGMDDPDDADLELAAGTDPDDSAVPFCKNTVLFANVKIQETKNFGWGLEFMNFKTETGGVELDGSRATFGWWYVF